MWACLLLLVILSAAFLPLMPITILVAILAVRHSRAREKRLRSARVAALAMKCERERIRAYRSV